MSNPHRTPRSLNSIIKAIRQFIASLNLPVISKAAIIIDSTNTRATSPMQSIDLEDIPIEEAKERILVFLREHPSSWTEEIAEGIGVDYIITNEALHQLKLAGILKSRLE